MKKDLIKDFNLPNYVKGKSFAEASEAIQKKFEGRNDPASKKTMDELLDRLKNAQEHIKQINQPEQPEMPQQAMQPQGQPMPQMNPELMQQLEQVQPGQNQMAMGGYQQQQMINQGVDAGLDMGAAALGPMGQAARGAMKMGESIGNSMNNKTGDAIASVSNLGIKDGISVLSDGRASALEKASVFALPPGVSAVASSLIKNKYEKERQNEAMRKQTIGTYNNQMNTYANGGYTNKYFNGGMIPNLSQALQGLEPKLETDNMGQTYPGQNENIESLPANKKFDWDKAGQKAMNYARYAPALANAYQLATMDKPETERLDRLDNRYIPNFVDEMRLTNQVNNAFNTEAAVEASGGSLSRLSSLMLGQQSNRAKALSSAYQSMEDRNINQLNTEQQFNLNLDRFNVGQSNNEKQINAQNKAAYDTNRSRFISALGENIGGAATEGVRMNRAEALTGYDWMGDYANKSDIIDKAEALGYKWDGQVFKTKDGKIIPGSKAKELFTK